MKKTAHRFFCLVTTAVFLFMVYSGSEAVSVISEKRSPEWGQCIIIDPGHGGEDGGAISCTGFPESEYNLKIALRLNDLFHLLGYQTKMIRTEDIYVYTTGETLSQKKISDLKERVRICNETKDSLLISIHQNMFSDNQYNGAQVFYAKTAGSKELAEQMQTLFISSLNSGELNIPVNKSLVASPIIEYIAELDNSFSLFNISCSFWTFISSIFN